jgi:hypothetical protein
LLTGFAYFGLRNFECHGQWRGTQFYCLLDTWNCYQVPQMLITLNMNTKKWSSLPWRLNGVYYKKTISCYMSLEGVLSIVGIKDGSEDVNNQYEIFRVALG